MRRFGGFLSAFRTGAIERALDESAAFSALVARRNLKSEGRTPKQNQIQKAEVRLCGPGAFGFRISDISDFEFGEISVDLAPRLHRDEKQVIPRRCLYGL